MHQESDVCGFPCLDSFECLADLEEIDDFYYMKEGTFRNDWMMLYCAVYVYYLLTKFSSDAGGRLARL